jgi:Pyruvate/2-oxoacid:ferredoxin oxidoreductase delta subunit
MANEKRLIDANVMRQDWLENGENEYVYDTNAVLDSIDAQPTVDAVEVVRCKDCKHYTPDRKHPWSEETGYDFSKIEILPFGQCCGQDFHFTEDGELSVRESDFCSNGERREGE